MQLPLDSIKTLGELFFVRLEKVMWKQDKGVEYMWCEVCGCHGGIVADASVLGSDTMLLSR